MSRETKQKYYQRYSKRLEAAADLLTSAEHFHGEDMVKKELEYVAVAYQVLQDAVFSMKLNIETMEKERGEKLSLGEWHVFQDKSQRVT